MVLGEVLISAGPLVPVTNEGQQQVLMLTVVDETGAELVSQDNDV